MQDRVRALHAFVQQHVPYPHQLTAASGDASFRRYFRVVAEGGDKPDLILMDAPPPEDVRPFVAVAKKLQEAAIHAPIPLAEDAHQGFLLLNDLGQHTLMQHFEQNTLSDRNERFTEARQLLMRMQKHVSSAQLPSYFPELFAREWQLFPDWYLARHLGLSLDDNAQNILHNSLRILQQRAQAAAQVFVHRDFMPRNLMWPTPQQTLGVLDFQDAVSGPIAYDLLCLYKDAFLSHEEDFVLDGWIRYHEEGKRLGLPLPDRFDDFFIDLEWIGLHRHFKVIGIFARLAHRDGKTHYLADLPRFINYVLPVLRRYRDFFPLLHLAEQWFSCEAEQGFTF